MSNGDIPYVSLDPYLESVLGVLDALQAAGLIPNLDPLQFLFDAFDGTPKEQDTELAALRLQASPWWPLRALGSNLQIWVKNGVPLSTGIALYRAQLSEWIRGTISSIEPIVYGRFNPYSLDHAIWLSMTSEQGDTAIVQLNATIAAQHALGPLPTIPTQPPTLPPGIVPGTGPNDIQVTADGDEPIDIGQTLIFQLNEIYSLLTQMGSAKPASGTDACCTNVVKSIANVVGQLSLIAAALANSGVTQVTVDFTPVTEAIGELVTAIGAYPPALQACCAAINTSLGNIANAINNPAGSSTAGIVDELKKMVAQNDVPDPVLQQMLADKFIPPQYSAVAQASPGPYVHAVLRFAASWSPIIGFLEHVLGDDTDATAGWRDNAARADAAMARGIKALKGFDSTTDPHTKGQLAALLKQYVKTTDDTLMPLIGPVIKTLTDQLKTSGPTQIGNINVNPDAPIATSVGIAATASVAAWLLSYAGIDEGESLTHMAELISGLVGLEELRDVQIGPLISHGIGKIAQMQAKKLFGQELPGAGALADLAARGLITNQQYFTWVPYTGLPGELWEQERQAAYRGLNARQMLRLIETNLFTSAEITDELTFTGMRPVSQARMEHAAPYLATQTERRSLISTLEKAYIAGLMADADLTGNIDSAENNTTRDNLILQRVKWEALIAETKELEAEYTTLYLGQVIDDATFRGYLGGIGLQPWKVSIAAAKAEARLNATLHRKELAAAAALQRATAAEERKAAMRNFTTGNVDAPALGIALVATGLTATQAAAWVDLAVLQKAGGLRWKYGLQLPAPEATLLQQRVTALTDQRKRQQISDAQYVSALQALNIPPNYVNALRATADALLTPAKTAFAIPVQTG